MDKVYQLPTHGRWFSPGTPASSTTKTGRHDIAEILLKVALKAYRLSELNFLFVLKIANIRCFILQRNTSLFDVLTFRKEFNVEPHNIHMIAT
jgi:hypothetical protein